MWLRGLFSFMKLQTFSSVRPCLPSVPCRLICVRVDFDNANSVALGFSLYSVSFSVGFPGLEKIQFLWTNIRLSPVIWLFYAAITEVLISKCCDHAHSHPLFWSMKLPVRWSLVKWIVYLGCLLDVLNYWICYVTFNCCDLFNPYLSWINYRRKLSDL